MSKPEYVVGFNFVHEPGEPVHVVLILKRRPDWQAGKLNGVGGHIEPGESPLSEMVREYAEETGEDLLPNYWTHFLTQEFDSTVVHFSNALQPSSLWRAP